MLWTRLLAAAQTLLVAGAVLCTASAARAEEGGLTVFAGTGTAGSSGDGGSASAASLDRPAGVAVAPDGTVYISDAASATIRAVTADGRISTVAGTGRSGLPSDEIPDGVPGTEVDLALPQALAVGTDGTVYIADGGLHRVFALSADRRLSTVAGTGTRGPTGTGWLGGTATIGQPGGLAVAADGTVYIGDMDSNRVYAVSPGGTITAVAGNGVERLTAAGGAATRIPVPFANSLAVDGEGTLWIADALVLHRFKDGKLSTVTVPGKSADGRWALSDDAGWPPATPPMNNITAMAAVGTDVYVLDRLDRRLLRLRADKTFEAVAEMGGRIDGPLAGPIAATASGTVYLADNEGHRVYAMAVRTDAPDGRGDGGRGAVPWWPFVAAGAAVIVIGAWLVAWRRRTS